MQKKNMAAIYGQGIGLQGNSYAIPTKGHRLEILTPDVIKNHVEEFKLFAANNPHLQFEVTKIGCGLAGYFEDQISPMFIGSPDNCILPDGWSST